MLKYGEVRQIKDLSKEILCFFNMRLFELHPKYIPKNMYKMIIKLLECCLFVGVSNALIFFKLSFCLSEDHMSLTVFSNLDHVHIKLKLSFYMMSKGRKDWVQI